MLVLRPKWIVQYYDKMARTMKCLSILFTLNINFAINHLKFTSYNYLLIIAAYMKVDKMCCLKTAHQYYIYISMEKHRYHSAMSVPVTHG